MNEQPPPERSNDNFHGGMNFLPGRDIDQEFIRRGFKSVEAEIDLLRSIFGKESYDLFILNHSDRTAFEEARNRDAEIGRKLAATERESARALDRYWEPILRDPSLDCYQKRMLLLRFFPLKLSNLIRPHLQDYRKAQAAEQEALCKYTPLPTIQLLSAETTELRKLIYNEVADDAFGAIGFTFSRKKQGLNVYAMKESKSVSLVIEADAATFKKQAWDHSYPREDAYWDRLTFDITLHGRYRREGSLGIRHLNECVASSHIRSYEDSRALEVAIRARALWIWLSIRPETGLATSSALRNSAAPHISST